MRCWIAGLVVLAACGDNLPAVGPPLAPADALFLVAHPDDEMIFMQPELSDALAAGSVTTVYATTADRQGVDYNLFDAAKEAYGARLGSEAWDCGAIDLAGHSVEHCRLRDRPVSIINLGLGDGGIPGEGNCLLGLVSGKLATVNVDGPVRGQATADDVRAMFVALLQATAPAQLHTLELAGTHGRDHSSHMFVAAFTLWAAAETGYAGALTWHRGYNVDVEEPTLDGDGLAGALELLGRYEACTSDCGPCGTVCSDVIPAHATWIARQYAHARVATMAGAATSEGACIGNCGDSVALDASGALRVGDRCLTAGADGAVSVAACDGAAAQYWVLDDEGHLWSGLPPATGGDMSYDHVRCLTAHGAQTCGAAMHPTWAFQRAR